MENKTKYNAIREKILHAGTMTAAYVVGGALGLLIGECLPSSDKPAGNWQETVSTYRDTNNNGLYDTVVRELPGGKTTTQRLGTMGDLEVSREQIERYQGGPIGVERIVIE